MVVTPSEFDDSLIDSIADALSQQGVVVLPNALSAELLSELQRRIQCLSPTCWQQAGVGRDDSFQHNNKIRSDKLHWISEKDPVESRYLAAMDVLREGLNRRLFLGLFDYECHFATYPEGAYYQKHVDALKGRSNRVLSSVLYLNSEWQKSEGGQLVVYSPENDQPLCTVMPMLGTLVLFLSETFPHEVLAASRQRDSVAGWFRVNSSQSGRADPPR